MVDRYIVIKTSRNIFQNTQKIPNSTARPTHMQPEDSIL